MNKWDKHGRACKASNKKTQNAIWERQEKGETVQNSKQLAKMIDRLYDTDYTNRYHKGV